MSQFNEPQSGFSPLGGKTFDSRPAAYAQPSPTRRDGNPRELSIEMQQTPKESSHPQIQPSRVSTSNSAGFATIASPLSEIEEKSFLSSERRTNTTYGTQINKQGDTAKSKKQLKQILIGGLTRWLITLGFCCVYILVMNLWQQKSAISQNQKRLFNTITTGNSIALGLNIASAFNEMALNMRWPVLASGKRSMVELEQILVADSMTNLVQFMFATGRPFVILACMAWLFINLLAQVGIAILSLTSSFENDMDAVQWKSGFASIPILDHFYPQSNMVFAKASYRDEQYMAHMYGSFGFNYGVDLVSSQPNAGKIYQPEDSLIWVNKENNYAEFIFLDSPEGSQMLGSFSVFTERRVNVTYECETHRVTTGGDGTVPMITVEGIGDITLSQTVADSTTFLTKEKHMCANNRRCSIVEAFESSSTDPWYYICNVTLGVTQNDGEKLSEIPDNMARIATASIAQVGYKNRNGISFQTYPRDSPWGRKINGSTDEIGMTMGIYSIASIAGAAQFNPFTKYFGEAPSQGFILKLNHQYFFYLIIFLIVGFHFVLCILTAFLSNKVKVGPSGHIGMSILLKPVTDPLASISDGLDEKKLRDAKRNTYIIYERNMENQGRWNFRSFPG
ncbi:BgTH12-07598 [Blumeria graminis f. sp. triticale]|uniref:Bgt-2682 n=3 Tax=Blumeria graminis TaxID=34373 RepID=A0A381LC05_BLUGR|nr:hypothetical protein BGT96224_2682 [Blumeria graminis f. sp. tritici 96224]CAD6500421.1 BgTH12-07598 [Blumeria graminis f. sp. triticale]VCU40687.1 Bgt-2682 [Blumeria graminis f. sp. tritici]